MKRENPAACLSQAVVVFEMLGNKFATGAFND